MNKIPDLLKKDLKVINIGLKSFKESLSAQQVPVVHMNFRPPAGGNKRLMEILKKLR